MITWIVLFLFELTAAGYCNNGAGGKFSCRSGMSDEEIAEEACRSVYSACKRGSCGHFYYYYHPSHLACNCKKKIGTYEFIYKNAGYKNVAGGYGGGQGASVAGNNLFVRKRTGKCLFGTPWTLALANLGEDIPISTPSPTENPSNDPTENPTNMPTLFPSNRPTFRPSAVTTPSPTDNPTSMPTLFPSNRPTLRPSAALSRPSAAPSRIPCKDQFPWCVYPNICDNDDFRQYCPFSCDDCLTAGPTTMPTASPTEDCAAREDILEGVIDHMLNHYLKNEED